MASEKPTKRDPDDSAMFVGQRKRPFLGSAPVCTLAASVPKVLVLVARYPWNPIMCQKNVGR